MEDQTGDGRVRKQPFDLTDQKVSGRDVNLA